MRCGPFRRSWQNGGPDDHAATCPRCTRWLDGQRRARSALTHLAISLDEVAPEDREPELRWAFRRHGRPDPSSRRWGWAWAAATAGLFLAVVALWGRPTPPPAASHPASVPPRDNLTSAKPTEPARTRTPVRSAPLQMPSAVARATARPAPPSRSEAGDAVPAPLGPAAIPEHLPTPAQPALSSPGDATADAAAADPDAQTARVTADDQSFHLLPGSESADLESGQIVRVRLRPDVLDAAGLPPRAGARGPVEAEVLVGPDGVARGIRHARPRR